MFTMVRNRHQHPQLIVQLAINEIGILRGNYTDDSPCFRAAKANSLCISIQQFGFTSMIG